MLLYEETSSSLKHGSKRSLYCLRQFVHLYIHSQSQIAEVLGWEWHSQRQRDREISMMSKTWQGIYDKAFHRLRRTNWFGDSLALCRGHWRLLGVAHFLPLVQYKKGPWGGLTKQREYVINNVNACSSMLFADSNIYESFSRPHKRQRSIDKHFPAQRRAKWGDESVTTLGMLCEAVCGAKQHCFANSTKLKNCLEHQTHRIPSTMFSIN